MSRPCRRDVFTRPFRQTTAGVKLFRNNVRHPVLRTKTACSYLRARKMGISLEPNVNDVVRSRSPPCINDLVPARHARGPFLYLPDAASVGIATRDAESLSTSPRHFRQFQETSCRCADLLMAGPRGWRPVPRSFSREQAAGRPAPGGARDRPPTEDRPSCGPMDCSHEGRQRRGEEVGVVEDMSSTRRPGVGDWSSSRRNLASQQGLASRGRTSAARCTPRSLRCRSREDIDKGRLKARKMTARTRPWRGAPDGPLAVPPDGPAR
jgi:hypothetical protein